MSNEDQIKAAELKKLVAETAKFEAETAKVKAEDLRIEFDYAIAQKEENKKWWLKKAFLKNFVTILTGFGILGFYINYAIIPAFNSENLQLKLQNQKAEIRNFETEQRLRKDSAEIAAQRLKVDSLYEVQIFLVSEKIKSDSARLSLQIQLEQYLAKADNMQKETPQIKKIQETIKYIKKIDSANQNLIPPASSNKMIPNAEPYTSQQIGKRIWRTRFTLVNFKEGEPTNLQVFIKDDMTNSDKMIPYKKISTNLYEIEIADDVTQIIVHAFGSGENPKKYIGIANVHRESGREDGDGESVFFWGNL
ncbi:MAG: hypothetical protein HYZ42_13130 [Bacteroidetes bacterium]|nr:hypothetical protein [Bacteroidota bacterium]